MGQPPTQECVWCGEPRPKTAVKRPRLSCEYMASHFAKRFDMELADLRRPDRLRDTIRVKREIIRLLRGEGYTLVAIGCCLGYADHTTVLHHLRRGNNR